MISCIRSDKENIIILAMNLDLTFKLDLDRVVMKQHAKISVLVSGLVDTPHSMNHWKLRVIK